MNIESFLKFMNEDVKMYDLTMRLSIHTPPWPSYMPLGLQYFKRIAGAHMGQGANGQIVHTSNHVGTHIDGEVHFFAAGRTIGDTPMDFWVGDAAVADISKKVQDYDFYTPEMIEEEVEVKEGDILVINTGYNRYGWDQPGADELRYFVRHPGPSPEFHKWAIKKKIKWIGIDAGSADHPMNTIIRTWHPKDFIKTDELMKAKYGKSFDELYPMDEYYQVMHLNLFPKGLVHAENLGGQINELGSKRVWLGLFPLRGIEMESSMCRIIALEPKK